VKSADKVTLVEAVNCAILNATLCHSINLVSLSWDVSVCCLLWDRGYMRNFQCGSSTSSFNSLACESHITTSQSFEEVYSYSSGLVDFCTIVFCFGTERKRLWNFELRENQGSTHSHYLSILFLRCWHNQFAYCAEGSGSGAILVRAWEVKAVRVLLWVVQRAWMTTGLNNWNFHDSGSDVDVIISDVLIMRKSSDLPILAGGILYTLSLPNFAHNWLSLNQNLLENGRTISSAHSRRKVLECSAGLRCIPCFTKLGFWCGIAGTQSS
jgi:hypothetical protein